MWRQPEFLCLHPDEKKFSCWDGPKQIPFSELRAEKTMKQGNFLKERARFLRFGGPEKSFKKVVIRGNLQSLSSVEIYHEDARGQLDKQSIVRRRYIRIRKASRSNHDAFWFHALLLEDACARDKDA